MSITDLARPEIQAMRSYRAAAQVDDTVRLNANEAPWTSSADHYRRPLNRYPEIRPVRLRAALADHFGCDEQNLLVTRGSSEAIDLLIRTFCAAGRDNIVTVTPTFSMYRHYADIQGAGVREVETNRQAGFRFDAAQVIAACDESTRLVFLCTPNNPTGTVVPRPDLEQVLHDRRGRSAVVVDEAYIEFSSDASAAELLEDHDNLIILRTLSKALALAGARCGAVISHSELVDMLDAVQAPYALATPVVECVETALQGEWFDDAKKGIAGIVAERERLRARVAELRFVDCVWPSAANFFLAQVANADQIMAQTRRDKVLLRHLDGEFADCIRITVGSREENDRLLTSLAQLREPNDA